jgi:hypothetical protein
MAIKCQEIANMEKILKVRLKMSDQGKCFRIAVIELFHGQQLYFLTEIFPFLFSKFKVKHQLFHICQNTLKIHEKMRKIHFSQDQLVKNCFLFKIKVKIHRTQEILWKILIEIITKPKL